MKLKKMILLLIIIIGFLSFSNCVYAKEEIERIDISNFVEPQLWQTFEYNLKDISFNDENKYEVKTISWAEDENRFNLFGMYDLKIDLQAKDGYEFPDYGLIEVYLNGENAEKGERFVIASVSEDKSSIEITINNVVDFTVPGIIFGIIACAIVVSLIIIIGKKSEKKLKIKTTKNIKKELSEESIEKVNYILKRLKEGKQLNAYKICFQGTPQVTDLFESKLGGLPYWDMKMEYPCNSKGEKLVLLAQINFEEEGEDEIDDDLLPKTGILQFFIDTDDLNGLEDKNGSKVIYHEKIDYSIKKEDVEKLGIKTSTMLDYDNDECFPFDGEYTITFDQFVDDSLGTRADIEDEVKKILKEKYNDTRELAYLSNYFTKEEYDYFWDKLNAFGSKLLGYAEFTQDDPRKNSKNAYYDTLLLQIDSEGPIMWGDCGVCHFFINKEDLKKRDFSNILYNWDCM